MQTVCTHVFALEEVTGIVAHGKRHGDAVRFLDYAYTSCS